MRAFHAYSYQPLCHLLVVRATCFDDCNREFAASFDSSWHPLFLWVAHVWQFGNSAIRAALSLSGGSCDWLR